jgi:hypothetical protein
MARIKAGKKCDVSHFEGEQREKAGLHGTQRRLDLLIRWAVVGRSLAGQVLCCLEGEATRSGTTGIGGGMLQVR